MAARLAGLALLVAYGVTLSALVWVLSGALAFPSV